MPRKLENKAFGNQGEDMAVQILKNNGYKIVTRNFRSKFGEIDVIAIDGDTLVFVEVKTRWSNKYGQPEEAVTPQKLYKIRKTADYFSLIHPNIPKKLRIDVVAIMFENNTLVSSKIIKVF